MKGLKISASIKIVIHQIKISEVCSALSFNKLEMNNMNFWARIRRNIGEW